MALLVSFGAVPAPAGATSYSNRIDVAAAHAGEVAGESDTDARVGTTGWRSGTFMIGDSITRIGLVHGLRAQGLGTGWEVSAVSGRDVSTLPYYVRDRLRSQSRLRRLVIALGTNATAGWTYQDLLAVVRLVPSPTKVILVTTYRDPGVWGASNSYRTQAAVQAVYSRWEKRLARTTAHTCVADWRSYAKNHRSALHDGVHPTTAAARQWAKIVARAVRTCG